MKRFLLLILYTLLCGILMGCETTPSYSEVLDSWYLSDINRFIRANGYPTSSTDLPNGNKVYLFSDTSGDWWCKTYLETDPTGMIVYWRYEGNACD